MRIKLEKRISNYDLFGIIIAWGSAFMYKIESEYFPRSVLFFTTYTGCFFILALSITLIYAFPSVVIECPVIPVSWVFSSINPMSSFSVLILTREIVAPISERFNFLSRNFLNR